MIEDNERASTLVIEYIIEFQQDLIWDCLDENVKLLHCSFKWSEKWKKSPQRIPMILIICIVLKTQFTQNPVAIPWLNPVTCWRVVNCGRIVACSEMVMLSFVVSSNFTTCISRLLRTPWGNPWKSLRSTFRLLNFVQTRRVGESRNVRMRNESVKMAWGRWESECVFNLLLMLTS